MNRGPSRLSYQASNRPSLLWEFSRETDTGFLVLTYSDAEQEGTREEQKERNKVRLGFHQVENIVEICEAYLKNPYNEREEEENE